MKPLAIRFASKVARREPEDCWFWTGWVGNHGYGCLSHDGRAVMAHRVAFFLEHGRWPEPCCLHRCDNPLCVNPAHLFEGTNADNVADKMAKGRCRPGRHVGEANPGSKLKEFQVRGIIFLLKHATFSQAAIARQFGVGHAVVSDIRLGKTWKHLRQAA